jgi:hypothetical protein
MFWIIYVFGCISLSSCIDNTFTNTFSTCVLGSTPVNCLIINNVSASTETNDINLNENVIYTISTSSSVFEKLSLTLNVKKINVKGNCTFKNLIVCYLDFICFIIYIVNIQWSAAIRNI